MPRQNKPRKPKVDPIKITVIALQTAKEKLLDAQGRLEIQQRLFEQKNKKLLSEVEALEEAVALNDETLRKQLVQKFEDTGQVAIGPGLDIRMRKEVQCKNEQQLLEWCLTHAQLLLTLDWKKIETFALAIPNYLPHVEVSEKPTPYIAKDLRKTIESYNNTR